MSSTPGPDGPDQPPDGADRAHPLDARLYRDIFGTAAMRAVFDDAGLIARWLAVEAALARAQAAVGLLPRR